MILKQENLMQEKRDLLIIKEEQVETLREEISDLSQLKEITEATKKQTLNKNIAKPEQISSTIV
jgi:hypothetical protein